MMTIAKGSQGKWFATTRTGENLPCLKHQFLGARGEYHEPKFYDPAQRRNVEYIDAIKQGRVLVARYDNHVEGRTKRRTERRTGYNEYIYTVEDVQHDETGLRCRFVDKERVG